MDGIFFLFHKTKTIKNTNKQNVDSCSPDQPEVLMRVRVREGQGPLFSFFDHSVIKKRTKINENESYKRDILYSYSID